MTHFAAALPRRRVRNLLLLLVVLVTAALMSFVVVPAWAGQFDYVLSGIASGSWRTRNVNHDYSYLVATWLARQSAFPATPGYPSAEQVPSTTTTQIRAIQARALAGTTTATAPRDLSACTTNGDENAVKVESGSGGP